MQVRGFGVEPPSIAEYRFDVVGGLAKARGSVWGPRLAGLSRHVGLPQMAGRHVREVSSRLAGPDGAFCLDGQLSGAIQTWSWDPVALIGSKQSPKRSRRRVRSAGRFFYFDEDRLKPHLAQERETRWESD